MRVVRSDEYWLTRRGFYVCGCESGAAPEGGRRSPTLRFRRWGRRLRCLRRLFAARDAFQPFDFLDVRQEHRIRRVLCQLGPDRVRLHGEEREALPADEVCSLDAFEECAGLFGRGLPAEHVVLQLADVVERLSDRLRYVVEHADDVDR